MTATREAPPRVSWTWTDLVLGLGVGFFGGVFVLAFADAAVKAADGGFDSATRTALESGVRQSAFEIFFLVTVLAIVLRVRRAPITELGWRRAPVRWLAMALPVTGLTLLTAAILGTLAMHLFPGHVNDQCVTVRKDFGHVLAVAIPTVSLVAPVAEETVFRGFLFGWLRRRMPLAVAVGLSAGVFALAHLIPLLFLPLFGVGVVLALVYERSGALWPGMVVHGLFNLVGIIQILGASSC